MAAGARRLLALEELHAVAAGALRRIHRAVGLTQGLARVGCVAEDGDADARSDDDALHSGERLGDDLEQPRADLARLVLASHALGDDHELVAAETPDEVARAYRPGEARADLADHLVGAIVPEGVVERLQPVKVDEENGDASPAARVRDRRVEVLEDRRAVRQAGEAIVACVVAQLLHRAVAPDGDGGQLCGDVHQREMLGLRGARLMTVEGERAEDVAVR